MRIIRINTESPLYAETERIWLESFPENERRDTQMHKAAVDGDERFFYNAIVEGISDGSADSCAWDYDCVASDAGIIDGDRVIGLLSWWALDGMVYGEHFAMSPSVRGRGLGEKVFTEVTGKFLAHGLPFVIEVEAPSSENPITARRIRFYERCGMHLLDAPYFQPPYRRKDAPIPMRLMSSDPSVDPSLAARLIQAVYPTL